MKTISAFVLLASLLPGIFCAAENVPEAPKKTEDRQSFPPPPPPPPPPSASPDLSQKRAHFRRGPGMWRVFSRLSEQERRELMELQRKDPEKFRQVLQQKADALFQNEMAERKELHKLASRCRSCQDEAEKARLKQELRDKIAKRFQDRIRENRCNLEETKRRLEKMEQDLTKRISNADAIIDAQLADMLAGRKNQKHPPRPASAPRVERVPERIP